MPEILDQLSNLVPAPANPIHHRGDWAKVEGRLGLAFPEDYKRLIERYGQGTFDGASMTSGLYIASYLAPSDPVPRASAGILANFYEFDEGRPLYDGKHLPHSIYPQLPGLIYCGGHGDRDTIAWLAAPSKKWSIVYFDPESGWYEFPDTSLVEFIVSVLEERSSLQVKRNKRFDSSVIKMGQMAGPHSFIPR